MSNMSYCRFANTYHDLLDCSNFVNETPDSESEFYYRNKLVELCQEIVDKAKSPVEIQEDWEIEQEQED